MIRGKLYFSDNNPETLAFAQSQCIRDLVDVGIDAATIYPTTGVWQGDTEPGFVVEILEPKGDIRSRNRLDSTLCTIARDLATTFGQQSVLVTVERIESSLFTLVVPEDTGRARDLKDRYEEKGLRPVAAEPRICNGTVHFSVCQVCGHIFSGYDVDKCSRVLS